MSSSQPLVISSRGVSAYFCASMPSRPLTGGCNPQLVAVVKPPRDEPYGTVAVFYLHGNR